MRLYQIAYRKYGSKNWNISTSLYESEEHFLEAHKEKSEKSGGPTRAIKTDKFIDVSDEEIAIYENQLEEIAIYEQACTEQQEEYEQDYITWTERKKELKEKGNREKQTKIYT